MSSAIADAIARSIASVDNNSLASIESDVVSTVTSEGMASFNQHMGDYAKAAVKKIDPSMDKMPELLKSTEKALAMHFKD